LKYCTSLHWKLHPLLSKKKKTLFKKGNRKARIAHDNSHQWCMLQREGVRVDASHRCRVTRWRNMIVRTTNKLWTTNKLKHRTFRQLKLKKMTKTRGHISASSLPSNVKEATAICCVNCACPARQNFLLIKMNLQICASMCW